VHIAKIKSPIYLRGAFVLFCAIKNTALKCPAKKRFYIYQSLKGESPLLKGYLQNSSLWFSIAKTDCREISFLIAFFF